MSFLVWVAAVIVAWRIGESKGRPGAGLALGILMGWLGVIIVLCLSETAEHRIARFQEERTHRDVDWGPPKGPPGYN